MTEEQEGVAMTFKVFATRAEYLPTRQKEIRQLNLAHKSPHIVALVFPMNYSGSVNATSYFRLQCS